VSESALLAGRETRTKNVTVNLPVMAEAAAAEHDRGLTADDYRDLGTIPVDRAEDCEQGVATATLVVADGFGTGPDRGPP
jgi:hypothetical protein